MTCFNCGKEIKDVNSKYCSNCGAPVEEPDEDLNKKEKKPKDPGQKWIIIACIIASLLAIIAIVSTGVNSFQQKQARIESQEAADKEAATQAKKEEEAAAKEAKEKAEAEEKAKEEAAAEQKAEEEQKAKEAEEAKAKAEAEAARTWTDGKTLKLREFMRSWGQTMGQQYQEYWPGQSINFYGVMVPDGILGVRPTQENVAVDGSPVVVNWSNGSGEDGVYNLVAVYSDLDSEDTPGAGHCYLFCMYNGESVVLHSSQNQGMPDGYFHFAPTENADLNNGYANILKNE